MQEAAAEHLPFRGGMFDAALAQLVVHFMSEPVAGIAEMKRVTRTSGVVAACVWDHGGGQGPLSLFWRAAQELDPEVEDESKLPASRDGHLAELFEEAGLREVERTVLDSASSTRASTTGGSPSRWGSGRRAHMSPVSTRDAGSSCASAAEL